jgi:hypothetical protein
MLSQTKNARHKRKIKEKKAAGEGREPSINGRSACVDGKGTEVIVDLIRMDAKFGVFHTVDWVREVVLFCS